MAMSYITADVWASWSNQSILQVNNINPSPYGNDSFEASDLLGSLLNVFWATVQSDGQLTPGYISTELINSIVSVLTGDLIPANIILLQTLLVAPLLLFQPSFLITHSPLNTFPSLSYLNVKVYYGQLASRIVIAMWTLVVFLVFGAVIYIACPICAGGLLSNPHLSICAGGLLSNPHLIKL